MSDDAATRAAEAFQICLHTKANAPEPSRQSVVAALAIAYDVNDRRGLKWEWQKIDADIVTNEIIPMWARLIEAAIIRREHATPAQVEGRMSEEQVEVMWLSCSHQTRHGSDSEIERDAFVMGLRLVESALLARAEADARRVAELERENRNENEAHALFAHATDNKIRALESELARLRDHLHEEHCCNCDEAARQGLAPKKRLTVEETAAIFGVQPVGKAEGMPPFVRVVPLAPSERVVTDDFTRILSEIRDCLDPHPGKETSCEKQLQAALDFTENELMKRHTILSGASGKKAGVCGTCGGDGEEVGSAPGTYCCPDCNGTGQATEARP